MKQKIRSLKSGQSMVLFALLLFVLIGMLAVVLDGGYGYLQRRQAQNAADAGALAGARELCLGNGYTAAYNRAQEYACTRNGADLPPATVINVDEAAKKVTVTGSITFQTFFSSLLGHPQMTAKAIASAGCYQPCYGKSVLPIVWSCQPPIGGGVSSSSQTCQQQRITDAQLQTYLAQSPPQVNPELYVIMDSLTYATDFMCLEDPNFDPSLYVGIKCDFDGDGEPDFLASGGRSWVDLDGTDPGDDCPPASGEGSSELDYWITNGYDCNLYRHSWVGQQTGVSTNVFDAAYQLWKNGNPLVLVPVFDDFCKDGDPRVMCSSQVHSQDKVYPIGGNQSYFHIIDYAAFYITCVRVTPSDVCPGQTRFGELNGPNGNQIFNNGDINSERSIEGYFLQDIPEDVGGKCTGGVDTGVYTLYLDQ